MFKKLFKGTLLSCILLPIAVILLATDGVASILRHIAKGIRIISAPVLSKIIAFCDDIPKDSSFRLVVK